MVIARRVAVQTIIRSIYGVCLLCLFAYIGLYADIYSTHRPPNADHWSLITGPAPGQVWPLPLPTP